MAMDRGRTGLIEGATPMVGTIVRAIAAQLPRHVDRTELYRAGMLGLVEAACRYDESRGVPFAAFAARRVRGAVFDALRSDDWVPRRTRAAARRLGVVDDSGVVDRLAPERDGALASALGWSEQRVRQVRAAGEQGRLVRLDDIDVADDDGDPEELVLRHETHSALGHALGALPDRERRVIIGYFLEDRTSSQLAAELGVTESRVSQLRTHALATLRRVIEAGQRGAISA